MTTQSKNSCKYFPYLLGIGIFSFLIIFFGYSYVGFFTRYATDDFCSLYDLEKYGWLGFQINRYLTWSGRFSATFFTAILDFAGDRIVMILPGLTLFVWVFCMVWSTYQFINLLGTKHPFWISLFTALLIIFAIVSTTPSLESTLFWHIGLITYIFPLILLTLFVGVIGDALSHNRHIFIQVIVGFSLAFVAGGHSETSLIGQIVALFFALLLVNTKRIIVPNRKAIATILWAGLVGSCLAFLAVRLAPGNSFRESFFPTPQLIPSLIKSNVYVIYLFFRPFMPLVEKPLIFLATYIAPENVTSLERALSRSASPIIFMIIILFSILLGYRGNSTAVVPLKRLAWYLVLLFIPFYLMMLSTIFPSQYIMTMFPPLRAVIIPQAMMVIFFLLFGYLLGWGLQNNAKLNQAKAYQVFGWAIMSLLVLNLLTTSAHIIQKAPEFQRYAHQYDQVMIEIKNAKENNQSELEIPLLDKPLFNNYIAFDENNPSINFCAIKYFDLDLVTQDVD